MPNKTPKKSLEKELKKNRQVIVPVIPEMIDARTKLGKGEIEVPAEIKEIEALIFSRGRLNVQFFRGRSNLYVVPSWVKEMLSVNSPGVISLGHNSSLINSNYRDWVAFGGIDCESEGTVTSKGLVVPLIDGYGILSGSLINNAPNYITRDGTSSQELLSGSLPIVINNWKIKKKNYQQIVFGGKSGKSEIGVMTFKKTENDNTKLLLSIRPFNQEGVSLINSITYRPKDQAILINKELAFKIIQEPEKIAVANYQNEGDSAVKLLKIAKDVDQNEELLINCSIGLANMTLMFPENTSEIEIFFRMNKKPIAAPPTLEKIKNTWTEKLSLGLSLKTGNHEIDRLFSASVTNLLLLVDPNNITPGPTEYHRFWCRDAAFLINALDKLGYHKYAEEALVQFIQRQRSDGFFYSHEGEFDSNGEGIWVLAEHAKFTKDYSWLEKTFDSIYKAAVCIINTRKQPKVDLPSGKMDLVKGLLPPGFSAEHLGPCDYFYWDNFWGVAGLREAANCAKTIKHKSLELLQSEYESYLSDLMLSIDQLHSDYGYLPVGPFRELDSAIIANLCAYHPTKIFNSSSEILMNTTNAIYKNFTHKGGFFHEVAWNCYGTYLTMHLAQAYHEANDEEKVTEILEWLVKHKTCAMGWAEGISPQTMRGGMGDSPHGWASADWIHLLRNMFANETKDGSLKLLSGYPVKYLTNGISTSKLKTHFGEIQYSAKIYDNVLKLEIENNLSLETYQIMSPYIVTSIRTDKGEAYIESSKCVKVSNKATKITIGLDV